MFHIANISDSIEHFRNISFRMSMLTITKCSSLLYNIYRYSSLLFICEAIIESLQYELIRHFIITTISNIVCSIKRVFCLIH